jgi:hypothetical protein
MSDLGDRYAATWEQIPYAGPVWAARNQLTAAEYQHEFDTLGRQGYRLRQVSVCHASGAERFSGLWELAGGPAWQSFHGLSAAGFQAKFDELGRQGYRVTYLTGNQGTYAGVWEQKGGPAMQVRHGLTSDQYQNTFGQLTAEGYRPTLVNGFNVGADDRYTCIFQKVDGQRFVGRHRLAARDLVTENFRLSSLGFAITHISGYSVGGEERYAVIWEETSRAAPEPAWARTVGTWTMSYGMTSDQYRQRNDALVAQGLRLRSVSTYRFAVSSGPPDTGGTPGGGTPGGGSPPPVTANVEQAGTGSDSVLNVRIFGGGFVPNEQVTITESYPGFSNETVTTTAGTVMANGLGGYELRNHAVIRSHFGNVTHTFVATGVSGRRSNPAGILA